MCGIAGGLHRSLFREEVIQNMVSKLNHRGPDHQVVFRDGAFTGGMARLSINDVEHGNQPLFNNDKSVAMLYNGEIYNSPELRKDLLKKGINFRSHSDGEVIPHLYTLYGKRCFGLLNGMFAISLWDSKKNILLLARDGAGEKPLYYSITGGNEIIYASEIKSLMISSIPEKRINHQAMWDMPTFLWVPEPETIFESIHALPRGSILEATQNGIQIEEFKYEGNLPEICEASDEEIIQTVRKVVEKSISDRLLSDVPVGCFLSSGLDSSIVTSVAASTGRNLDTFTIGFENVEDPYHGSADESVAATAFAKELGTTHHNLHVSEQDFFNLLDDFCYYGDQPFSVSSGLGILKVCEYAYKSGIKVLLSGDGADESFGGYSWYPYLRHTPQSPENIYSFPNFQSFGIPLEERLSHIYKGYPEQQAFAWHFYADEKCKSDLFHPDIAESSKSSLRHFKAFKSGQWSPEDFIAQDREFYFPQEMLRKADRMSMARSVEVRVPFASPETLHIARQLKFQHFVKGNTLKWALRKAFEDILPNEVISRPKHGFNVPIDYWLKGKWNFLLQETFSKNSALAMNGFLHKNASKKAVQMLHDPAQLNGHALFSYIMLNRWMESNI